MNMDTILSFLADNYKWFMIGSAVLLLALIGFIVDGKRKKKEEIANMQPVNEMPQGSFAQNTMMGMENNNVQNNMNQVGIDQNQVNPNDTIFTSAPVNNTTQEEKLVIEAPQSVLSEAPVMTSESNVAEQVPAQPQLNNIPPVQTQPQMQQPINQPSEIQEEKLVIETPTIQEAPQMQAPSMESPVSMVAEAPVMPNTPQPQMQQPISSQAPQEQAPIYQNTIQQ